MADTIPGSALVTPVPFGTTTETVSIIFDRVRINIVEWNYVAGSIRIKLDYGRENPLAAPASEWFTKNQYHEIINLAAGDTVILNGVTFTRLAGTHYTTLVAAISAGTITTMEDLEDKIFARLIAIGYFPLGVET